MSYLFIVVIGTVAGWVGGQYIKGNEEGIAIDLACGAVGACLFVLLSRMVGPPAAAGYVMSTIVAVVGALGSIFAMRAFMKARLVPAPKVRRRR
jgi:uncharacterized membrane protein YeaQ/YmgE (transglycosylase-associated protein family)